MPRRSGDSAPPLSFFDGEDGPELGVIPRKKRPPRVRPSVPARPTIKKTHGTPKSEALPGTKRFNREQIRHYKELMQQHFGNTSVSISDHQNWPLYGTFHKIEDYIQKVKTDYLNPIWEHQVNHKTKVEQIHSKHVDTSGWDFASIYKRVSSFAEENGQMNRLTLEKPWAPDSGRPYANVVLAWLFAAKKQLMWTLTVYMKKNKAGDSEAAQFVKDSEAGAAARAQFKLFKAKLHQRAPREPAFADHAALERQYALLHPHRSA
mmetsp:Transcript_46764/g.97869  ORF Transcript_46764/g.97869 Transcript_46764/m.97869 type:complete len:263 (-) Transcript_46764:176-964(-)